jgi:hypothetical protein
MIKPEGTRITNHTELRREIMRLNQKKAVQEEALRKNFRELYYSLHPVEIIKNAVSRIKESSEAKSGLVSGIARMGLGVGASFLFKKLLKNRGLITSFLAEKVGSMMASKSSGPVSSVLNKIASFFGKKRKMQKAF